MDDHAVIAEILRNHDADEQKLEQVKSIEVGNIFKLGSRFSDAFNLSFTSKEGGAEKVLMGCYGLGPSRLMGAVAEILSDEKGLVWPSSIAPFAVHLVSLVRDTHHIEIVDDLYQRLGKAGIETLYDDRTDSRAGEKFSDADLIGVPYRLLVSPKTLETNVVELKHRTRDTSERVPVDQIVQRITSGGG